MIEHRIQDRILTLIQGDITEVSADAIVNAANSSLLGGGGVDGAIHRVGGPSILAECEEIRARQGGCETGQAVATTAGELDARHVIHTVGPVWDGGGYDEDALLASCYRESLRVAHELGCKSVAFPSVSTGVYSFPVDRAAWIALEQVARGLDAGLVDHATFVLFSKQDLEIYTVVSIDVITSL